MKILQNILFVVIAICILLALFLPVLIWNTMTKIIRHEDLAEYYKNVAIGFDQAGGSILYNQEKFTISSWTWYMCGRGYKANCLFMHIINMLMGSETHCEDSFKNEMHEIQEDGEIK